MVLNFSDCIRLHLSSTRGKKSSILQQDLDFFFYQVGVECDLLLPAV